jgi:alpha-1,6-mannosyltransferase
MAQPVLETKAGRGSRQVLPLLIGLGIASGAVYFFNFRLPAVAPLFSRPNQIQVYLVLLLFLFVLYLGAVLLVLKNLAKIGHSPGLIGIIVIFALLFRTFLLPSTPSVLSNDMYRYIWDGRVQQSGINPYRYPPAAEELEELRDERVFPNLNRKQVPTIYPAAAQSFFLLFHVLTGDSILGYKGFMVFFDALTLLALAGLLKTYGFEPARLLIYAWNPLVVFEIAYSGHLEGLTVFFLVTAFLMHGINRKNTGVMLLAVAGALKLYPSLLLAALLNRGRRIKGILLFGSILALLYLPYAGAGRRIIGFLPAYLNNPYESFNLGLKNLLLLFWPTMDYARLSQLFLISLLVAALVILTREKQKPDVLRAAYWLTGMLLLFMPAALHPWYVILIIPFLAFFPNPAWLCFTGTVSLSYLKYVSPGEIMPTWVLLAEYLPLFFLLAVLFFLRKKGFENRLPTTFSVQRRNQLTEVKK